MKVKVTQLCLTLWDPRNYTVHGILQAKILEWVAFLISRGSSQTRDWTQISCTVGGFFTNWVTIFFFRPCYVPSTVVGAGDSLVPALKDLTGSVTRALWEQREGHLTRCEDWGSLSGGRDNWAETLGRNWPLEKEEHLGREEHPLDRESREKRVLGVWETEEFRLAGSRGQFANVAVLEKPCGHIWDLGLYFKSNGESMEGEE